MEAIGADFGASTVDIVHLKEGRVLKAKSWRAEKFPGLEKALNQFKPPEGAILGVTGGKAWKINKKRIHGLKVKKIPELRAIAVGGLHGTGKNKGVVASCGTGTCVVQYSGGRAVHLGGTGIGGGTVEGLSRRLFGAKSPEVIGRLAKGCKAGKVDLTVGEVIGKGIGKLSGRATAANLAKLDSKSRKKDAAAGIISMASEAAGVVACLAAFGAREKEAIFTGKLIHYPGVKTTIRETGKIFGVRANFSAHAGYATALGAARIAGAGKKRNP